MMMMYTMSRLVLVVVVVALLGDIYAAYGFPAFTAVIPNGRRVPCPRGVTGCSSAGLCEGAASMRVSVCV